MTMSPCPLDQGPLVHPSRLKKEQKKEPKMLQEHNKLATWPKWSKIQINGPNGNKAIQNERKRGFGRGGECLYIHFQGPSSPLL